MSIKLEVGKTLPDDEIEKYIRDKILITDMDSILKQIIVYLEMNDRKYKYKRLPLGLHRLEIMKVG